MICATAAILALGALASCGSHAAPSAPSSQAAPSTAIQAPRTPPSTTPSTARATATLPIRYLVAPHPDDEFAIWSMAQDTDHYPVLIVLTEGEKTGSCAGGGLQTALGERTPQPQPFAGKSTAACRAERVDSLLAFLRDMGRVDPRWLSLRDLGERAGPASSAVSDPSYRMWVGDQAALLVFDLGDGAVTRDSVAWAIAAARAARADFPTQQEGDIVGMGYHNTTDPDFMEYDHPDQLALRDVLTGDDLGLPGGQFVRTYPGDPEKTVTIAVDSSIFQAATAVSPAPVDPVNNPDARRVGALQVDYGWLAFPDGYWYAEKEPIHSFYSSSQDFTESFGGASQ